MSTSSFVTLAPAAKPLVALPIALLVSAADDMRAVRRRDLAVGDRLIVSTRNSIYSLTLAADGRFVVEGGIFSREGGGARTLGVNGCTAGGHALFTGIVGAPGLFLEYSDGTRTTRIRTVRHRRSHDPEILTA